MNINYGGSLHHNFDDDKYIQYAQDMPIAKILIGNKFCSGVMFNDSTILTIKHAIEYHTNVSIYYNDTALVIDSIVYHRKEDLAIIKLNSKVNSDQLIFYEDVSLIGKECSIGGYGIKYEAKHLRNYAPDLLKRAGKNIITWQTENDFECQMDINGIDLEFIPTIGDSGGPVFIDNKLVGLNKYVKSSDGLADSSYGDVSGHVRLIKYASWIMANL